LKCQLSFIRPELFKLHYLLVYHILDHF
jgi:hypothetical protein